MAEAGKGGDYSWRGWARAASERPVMTRESGSLCGCLLGYLLASARAVDLQFFRGNNHHSVTILDA